MIQPDVYWLRELDGGHRLAIMPRPRSGEWLADEVAGWNRLGVQTVVSLLESHEGREFDLADEQSLCERATLEFVSFPIPNRGLPKASWNSPIWLPRFSSDCDLASPLRALSCGNRGLAI